MMVLIVSLCLSCGGDEGGGDPSEVIPSELTLTITVQGSDANNPNGDGSGVIECVSTATDAVRYEFDFGSGSSVFSTTGKVSHTYDVAGTNPYQIKVTAFSDRGESISITEDVQVFVANSGFDDLVFSDEFDTDGALDNTKWIHETEGPNNGRWWNDEQQHYTDRLDNSFISEGTLKIVAKKESYTSGGVSLGYTSARLNSKFTFTYGRIDIRAKLPSGEGTWPAIWTLGKNIDTAGWPACGEIDIMEHWGHEATNVSSATHTPACSGANSCDARIGSTTVSDFDTEFHVYSAIWTEEEIRFYIDNEFRYSYNPPTKTASNWPFTADQFILLNVAMGGSWFSIDPNFSQSAMEIDYVRVYQ